MNRLRFSMQGAIMKRNALTMLALAAGLGLYAASAGAAENELQGPSKAAKLAMSWCGECHGRDGNAVSPQFPRLAGQPAEYLETELKTLRSRTRKNADSQDYMWGVVHKMDDETLSGLAKYFASQRPSSGGSVSNAALAERGKQIFESKPPGKGIDSCKSCHGTNGEGKDEAPRLAGQHRGYLIKQLKVIQAGQRPAPDEMHAAVKRLNSEEIEAVAEYLQSK